ncbi:MAG: DNA repair exonuclease [candidate division Zixibacteria bacterium]|nr:DNA repair exonuclease [candidate division Zixibacteria bacterium]
MAIRILCTGDIHLGRRPTRIPDNADLHALKPTGAWESLVSIAIDQKMDVVVLTGDVVDESNKYYEAFSSLQSGVKHLVNSGIPVLAVSGNHDYDVLPRLVEQIPDFHLLGRGGRWDDYILEKDGTPIMRFQGWSFPTRHVSHDPLQGYVEPNDELPTVGVLHCDCDVPTSNYGPVSLTALKAKKPIAWLLGHIHKPRLLSDNFPLVLYPGSLQGLDPSESGTHGAWLVTLGTEQAPKAELLPLAQLRWEEIEVSIDSVDSEDAFQRVAINALRERHKQIRSELGQTRWVGCRLQILGRSSLHRHLPRLITDIQSNLTPSFEDVEYFVEKIEDLSRPDIPLEDIARSNDLAGLLARRLLTLEHQDPLDVYQELINAARRVTRR